MVELEDLPSVGEKTAQKLREFNWNKDILEAKEKLRR